MEKKNSPTREAREDGTATKELLIETAGRLIARQGYDKTTSKQICETVKANVAAINYHFGGREGLYLAVLRRVHQYLLNAEELDALAGTERSAKEKIHLFLDILTKMVQDEENWAIRVWVREIVSPSPLAKQIVSESAAPKLKLIMDILSGYTGFPFDSPELHSALTCVVAPFLWLLLIGRSEVQEIREIVPIRYDDKSLPEECKLFVLAGLEAIREKQE